jgi:hypothetical protein
MVLSSTQAVVVVILSSSSLVLVCTLFFPHILSTLPLYLSPLPSFSASILIFLVVFLVAFKLAVGMLVMLAYFRYTVFFHLF